jgi:hypothetical protein
MNEDPKPFPEGPERQPFLPGEYAAMAVGGQN